MIPSSPVERGMIDHIIARVKCQESKVVNRAGDTKTEKSTKIKD
jgi:hypothetical protein